MKKIDVMVLRPTIFSVDAKNFEDAKEKIIDGLVNSRQMKPNDYIEFREIVDGNIKEDGLEECEQTIKTVDTHAEENDKKEEING